MYSGQRNYVRYQTVNKGNGGMKAHMPDNMRDQLSVVREGALRARRIADSLSVDADRDRLLKHAEDLDRQATELEATATKAAPSAPKGRDRS